MSTLRTTIDDVSPLIDYQPVDGWLQKNSTTDSIGANYYADTFTRATQLGASASFTFNGTSITIYGGKSPNHGNYTIDVDGEKQDASGFSSTNEYQVPIYSVDGLNHSTHTVTITDTQYAFVDIDYLTWTSDISSTGSGAVSQLYVDDTDDSFHYLPSSAWSTNIPDSSKFSNGSAVSIYGTVGPSNGPFSVKLDGLPDTTYQGSKTTYATQTLLFYASNLGYSDHSIVITSTEDADLEIDYALIHMVDESISPSSPPVGPDSTGSSGNNIGNSVGKASLTPAAIVGVVGGVVTIAGLLIALCVSGI
ncbi:hypothetical protein C0991_003682 [Blastosporella zonata]|nr:hypothetical protein C0991_003682 [Blastosporella zonata]